MSTEDAFRQPTSTEAKLIRRLLEADFPGKREIARQLRYFRVRTIDNEGSFELELTGDSEPVVINKRIPVEAEGVDEDGIHVHILLHVDKGFVKELEIYKDGSSAIRRMPSPDDIEVIVLG